MSALRAPFPWFGGKSRAAALIWERLGVVQNYVEPFAGSLAVLLGAPQIARTETVNDKDGFICNVWRAIARRPDEVAEWAKWPITENDLHARHAWLVARREELTSRLEGDPDYCDPKIAGWWLWGIACWIGGGWCSGKGPWHVVDGSLVREGRDGPGVKREIPNLCRPQGVNRKRIHVGNSGRGVKRQLVFLSRLGQGVNQRGVEGLQDWMRQLSARLRRVRVCCGDWSRVCGPAPTTSLGLTGIVLDPPYSKGERDMAIYSVDSGSVAAEVREWAIAHGEDPKMRIALCGYDTEHVMPTGWTVANWVAHGGYARQAKDHVNNNRFRETIWFSPHCLPAKQAESDAASFWGPREQISQFATETAVQRLLRGGGSLRPIR